MTKKKIFYFKLTLTHIISYLKKKCSMISFPIGQNVWTSRHCSPSIYLLQKINGIYIPYRRYTDRKMDNGQTNEYGRIRLVVRFYSYSYCLSLILSIYLSIYPSIPIQIQKSSMSPSIYKYRHSSLNSLPV